MKQFHLEIVTPDGLVYDSMVESLLVSTDDGDVEFLACHIDYIASLAIGRARIKVDGENMLASISGGFVTFVKGEARLVAITFEFADAIDVKRAEAAAERAKELISSAKDSSAEQVAVAKLKRALNRINVANM